MSQKQDDAATTSCATSPAYHAAVRPLTAEEYNLLKDDIATRGIISPIIKDAAGHIVDGYHRNKIAAELGLTDIPIKQVDGTEADLQAMAIALNVCRRQLTVEEITSLCVDLRREGKSEREIARAVGMTPGGVHKALSRASQEAPVPDGTPDRITGADGKSYPARGARKPKPVADLTALSDEKADALPAEPVVSRLEQFIALWDHMSGAERLNVYRLVNSDEWRSSRPPATSRAA
jgi:hypothetical protein